MAGFEVIIYGRFWVIAEGNGFWDVFTTVNRVLIAHDERLVADTPATVFSRAGYPLPRESCSGCLLFPNVCKGAIYDV